MLLKNGNAAEKISTRIAAATQRSKIRTLSFLFAHALDSPETFIKTSESAKPQQFAYIRLDKSCAIQNSVSHL